MKIAKLATLAISAMLATAAYAETEVVGSWMIETRVDPFTDEERVFAVSFSSDEYDVNALAIGCKDDEIMIAIGSDALGPFSSSLVGMRIGLGEPTFAQWNGCNRLAALHSPNPMKHLKEMLESNAKQLVFRLWRDGKQLTSVFNLSGFDVAHQKVAEACVK